MTLRSEVINRRHIKSLETIGPEIKEETDSLRRALNEAGIPIPDLLQTGGVQEILNEGGSRPVA